MRSAGTTALDRWGALATAWAAVGGTIAWWVSTTPTAQLRAHLTVSQFWALEATTAIGAGLGLVEGLRLWRDDTRGQRGPLIGVSLVALVTALTLPPATNRIYYDEQIYQSIGQNLSDLRLAQMCNDGVVEYGRLQCRAGEYNKQPYAYPHLLSAAYRVVGVSDSVAPAVNVASHVVTVAAVFLIVWLQFASALAAVAASLVLALTPEQLRWSITAAVEPTTAMAAALTVLAAVQFTRTRRPTALGALVVAAVWAVQFRPEAVLLLPVVALLVWQRAPDELARPRFWWVVLGGLVLVAVHVGHLVAIRDEGWGTDGARLAVAYVRDNLRVNGGFFLGDQRFPVLYTALAVAGVVRGGMAALPYLLGFVAFFGIQLFFYAGSYDYGADVRYSLTTYPWLAVLAGLGTASLATTVGHPPRWVVIGVLLGQFTWYTPLVRETTDEAWAARADVAFAKQAAASLRGNRYVLTHNPGMFHVWGVNAGQMSLVSGNATYVNYLATRFAGGVYLHWNFWCSASDTLQRSVCAEAARAHPLHERMSHDERDYRYRIYQYVVPGATPLLAPPEPSSLDFRGPSVP